MKTLKYFVLSVLLLTCGVLEARVVGKSYDLESPSGILSVEVEVAETVTWSVSLGGATILETSQISMKLSDGTIPGPDSRFRKAVRRSVDRVEVPVVYKKAEVRDSFNELTLAFKDFSIVFRAYDQGAAYRFVSSRKQPFKVLGEQAEFRFPEDFKAYVPYTRKSGDSFECQFFTSFESQYSHIRLSEWNKERLAFLPITVEAGGGVKVCITESDLTDYPGMYLYNGDGGTSLRGVFAPYPKEIVQGGHNMLQGIVRSREDYIAEAYGTSSFPWRIVIVGAEDKDLLECDLPWLLGTPSEPGEDYSWVRPGKVAWDWWNAWNLYGVDFEAGVNNDTYKYYIDFASENGIEYVILDEGWAVRGQADLFQVVPEIDLPMLCSYAAGKGVGIILWAGYMAFEKDMERACREYSAMGVKGFKVDFMDRDDQAMVRFYRKAAETAAKYHLIMDFHGAYKPSGMLRTYPNVINHEGVYGLENLKWGKPEETDLVTYEVTIPFVRLVAGPSDYTQGAMRNATRRNYRPISTEPMSQGTRCRQLAEYVVFDAPLNMLCDSPSNYLRERECLDFIAGCPTTWDETVALDGKIGEYVAVARRKGDTWYVGAITGWDERDLTLDLSFISGCWRVEMFRDGPNAHRAARDYSRDVVSFPSDGRIKIHMAPGGGWAAVIR